VPNIQDLHNFKAYTVPRNIQTANGACVQAKGIGTLKFKVTDYGPEFMGEIPNVEWTPEVKVRLLNPAQLFKNGYDVTLDKGGATIKDPQGRIIIKVNERGNVYPFNLHTVAADSVSYSVLTDEELDNRLEKVPVAYSANSTCNLMRWHQRLGHLHTGAILDLAEKFATGITIEDFDEANCDCLACIEGKQHKLPFKTGRTRATHPGEVLHIDLAGPMETLSFDQKKYFIIIIDDYSRAVWTETLASKLEVLQKVRDYITQLETLYGAKVQSIMADNGSEFINNEFRSYIRSKGIALFTSVPYTPQQNGIAERGIRTLTEGARAMLYAAKLPKNMWSVAVKTKTYLKNRSPTRANQGQTPLEKLTGEKPDLSHLRTFGCPVSVAIPSQKRKKWDPRSKMGYMVGYEPYSSGYLIWYPGSKRTEKARDVIFHEDAISPAIPIPYGDEGSLRSANEPPLNKNSNESVQESEPKQKLTIRIPPRPKPNETSRLVSSVPDFPQGATRSGKIREESGIRSVLDEDGEENDLPDVIFSAMSKDPTISEALNMPGDEGKAWEEARQAEWRNMVIHNVFGPPEEPPPGTKVLKTGTVCRGTYRNGELVKRKVRIVVKGFSQIPGLHFNETYAPVMRWESFRMLLAIGASRSAKIRQFDVKSAYLHGTMKEKVWVTQPEGFEEPGKEHLALPLLKALYGTKQGGNEWRKTLYEFMVQDLSWSCSNYDAAVYFKNWDDGTWAIVGFWVDDAITVGSEKRLFELEQAFREQFGISGDREADYILGTTIQQDAKSNSVYISQKDYIQNIAEKFEVQNCKPVRSPIPLGVDFSAISQPETEQEKEDAAKLPYRELIGSLMFAAVVSRPDIAYSVNKLAQYSSNPSYSHWKIAKRILQYLYTTRNQSLRLGGGDLSLHAYADADFAGDTDDRRSTGGYAVFLGQGAISWSSRKQSTVALSSTEAEYIALSEAAREILWIRHFLAELDIKYNEPTVIYEDNQGTIAFASNQRAIRRMKHIEVKFHFVRNLIETGIIQLEYKNTKDMIADLLTKSLSPSAHAYHAQGLGLSPSKLEEEC
jgi:hypothetical protein